jgi:hypothetical protein
VGTKRKSLPKKRSNLLERWHIRQIFLGILAVFGIVVGLAIALAVIGKIQVTHRQDKLQPFYDIAGLSTSGAQGEVVRSEPMTLDIQNGTATRVLYRTQRADGSVTFSSGMIFVPNNTNAGSPRPVVAWAHGSVGMGRQCAPSRIKNPVVNIGWVNGMLKRGWVVTASDYAGLGTPGIEGYLVGGDEARDVLNSVRATRDLPAAQAGSTFAVWGHSQGGHSALFTASEAGSYAPELKLVGTVATAPAAELVPLMSETYGTTLDWVIGPYILSSWPTVYPNLDAKSITTANGYNNYRRIAEQCIEPAALGGLIRTKLNQQFFSVDVSKESQWRAAATNETAPLLAPSQPLLVSESLTDQVITPNTNALYIQKACQAKSNLTSLWLTDVTHSQLAEVTAPYVAAWLEDRFEGKPTAPTCGQQLPIAPATVPSI